MKQIKPKHSMLEKLLLGIGIFALTPTFMALFEGANMSNLDKDNIFIFSFGVVMGAFGLYFSVYSKRMAEHYQNQSLHQSIDGNYIPTDELNNLVRDYYLRNGGIVSGYNKEEFVLNWKDALKLLKLTDRYTFRENIAKQIIYCEIERNGSLYKAVSASKEMSVCIAFLKSCGVDTDHKFE